MNAGLEVKISTNIKTRDISERFKPTKTWTETFVLHTDLDNHISAIEPLIDSIWNYTQVQRANVYSEITLHYSLRIDNVTAATPSAGSILQPKQHLDGALADGEFTEKDILRQRLLTAVQTMRTLARY